MITPKRIAGGLIVAGMGLMAVGIADARAQVASWYGNELAGNPMANGQPFDPEALTAAHKTLPLGSKVWVSNGSKSVQVTITDRGPYTPGRDIDLSARAARTLGIDGVAAVEMEPVSSPTPTTEVPQLPKTGGIGG